MSLTSVVPCSAGLHVAQRGAVLSPSQHGLEVGTVAPVDVPAAAGRESRRHDGRIWRRVWSAADGLVIQYVGVSIVRVDPTGRVTFDRELDPELEQHLLLDHVLPLTLAWRGFLVLHGAFISRRDSGVVLLGSTGAGKSTLTAFALQRGWTLGGDDGVVVHVGEQTRAEPTYSTVRLTPTSADMLGIDPTVMAPVAGKRRLKLEPLADRPTEPVAVKVFAVLARGTTAKFSPLVGAAAHARLFSSTFQVHEPTHPGLASLVARLAHISESSQCGVLTVPSGVAGLSEAERMLRALLDGDKAP